MKYLLIGLLFISSSIFTQSDQKSKEILNKLSADIKSYNSFYIDFSMQVQNNSTGENSTQKGFGYVKGEKYYASLGETILISNAVKSWTVIKGEKVTYQSDVDEEDEEAITPKKLMTIWESGFNSKYDKKTTLNQKEVHQINLYPINPGKVNYHTITLYIDVANNELYKAVMKTKGGGIISYTINSFEKNKAIEDTKFVYNPKDYPGYQLIRD